MAVLPNDPIYNAPHLFVSKMNIVFGSKPTLVVTAGICRDSTDSNDIVFDSLKVIDSNIVGAGGLDSGVLQYKKLYYIFALGDSTKYRPSAAIASLSTSPVVPSGYDMVRRIGYAYTVDQDVGNPVPAFLDIKQSGSNERKEYYFYIPVNMSAGPLSSATYVGLPLNVGTGSFIGVPPTAISCLAQIYMIANKVAKFLPYNAAFIGPAGNFSCVHFESPTSPIVVTSSLPVGLLGGNTAAILYSGDIQEFFVSGFVDQL